MTPLFLFVQNLRLAKGRLDPFVFVCLNILAVSVCAVLMSTTISFATDKDCSVINKAADAAREAYEEVSVAVYDSYLVDKDDSFWDNCMGNIIDGGFSFDLSIPSLSGLINKACNYAKSEVRNQIDSATQEVTSGISADAGYGFSAGGSASATRGGRGVSVRDSSSELSNNIWRAIK